MRTRLALALIAMTAVSAAPLHAQVGGLIKKKVSDAVKNDKPKDQTPKPDDASKSRMPRTINQSVLTAFRSGLEVERDERAALAKRIEALPTREKFEACKRQVAMSPEGMKAVSALANLPENAKPDDMQKAINASAAEMEKLYTAKCGEDPEKYGYSWRQEQLKKAEAAAVARFAAGLRSGDDGPFLGSDRSLDDDLDLYQLLKEWIPPFCTLPAQQQKQAAANGVAIPGSGKGMYFIYTAAEAAALSILCEPIMKLLAALS
jgi:hypothetical protein